MATGSELASAWVTIYPKFARNFNSSITKQVSSAVSSATKGVGTGVKSTGVQIGRSLGTGIKTGLSATTVAIGNVIASGISSAVSTVASAVSSTVSDAVDRADILNNFPKMMTQWGESASDAEAAVKKLRSGVEGLPTTTASMVQATQRLYTMLGDVGKASDAALGLNDMLLSNGATGALYENAFEQFSQMLAAGKVDMMAWRSVVNAAPKSVDTLAKSLLGATATANDLYDALPGSMYAKNHGAKLEITDLVDAIIELDKAGENGMAGFSEQAHNASKGIKTSLTNIKNAITNIQTDFIDALGRDKIASEIDKLKAQIYAFGKWFNASPYFAKIKARLNAFDMNAVIGKLKSQVLSTVRWLQENIVPPVRRVFDSLKGIITHVVDYFRSKRDLYEGLFLRLLNAAAGGVESIAPRITRVIDTLTSLLERGLDLIVSKIDDGTFGAMIARIKGFAQTIIDLARTVWPYIKRIGTAAGQILGSVGGALQANSSKFEGLFIRILDFITTNFERAVPLISDVAVKLIDKVGQIAEQISERFDDGTIQNALDTLWKLMQRVYDWVVTYIFPVAEGVWSHFRPIIDRIGQSLTKLANGHDGGIGETLGNGFRLAGEVISGVFDWIDVHWTDLEALFVKVGEIAGMVFDGLQKFIDEHGDELWQFANDLLDILLKSLEQLQQFIEAHGDQIYAFFEGLLSIGGGVAGFAADNWDWLAPTLLGFAIAGKIAIPVLKGLYKGMTKLKGVGETGKWWKNLFSGTKGAKVSDDIVESFADKYYKDAAGRWRTAEGKYVKASVVEAERAAAEAAKSASGGVEGAAKTLADTASQVSESTSKVVNETAKVADQAAESCKVVSDASKAMLSDSEVVTRNISQAVEGMDTSLGSTIEKMEKLTSESKLGAAELPEGWDPRLKELTELNKGEIGETMSGVARDAEAMAGSSSKMGEAGTALKSATAESESALGRGAASTEAAAATAAESASSMEAGAASAERAAAEWAKTASEWEKTGGTIAGLIDDIVAKFPKLGALGKFGKAIPFLGEILMAADVGWETFGRPQVDYYEGKSDYEQKHEFIDNALNALYDYESKYGGEDETRTAIMFMEDAQRLIDNMDASTGWADNLSWDYLKNILSGMHFDVTADGSRIAKMMATDSSDANASLVLSERRGYATA